MSARSVSLRYLSFTLGTVLLLFTTQASSQDFYSVPSVDAPELAPRGIYNVGVRTEKIIHPAQVDILNFDKSTNQAPLYDRQLVLEIWYPAIITAGQTEQTTYAMPLPGGPSSQPSKTFNIDGKALRDAAPVTKKFPLVVVSHGYPGSRYFLSYLGENLASKGFVVASIDHTDSIIGAVRPFPSTLLNRANDQLFTIDTVEKLSRTQGHFLNGLIDESRVAIIGYSMGGYGALASAGAGYSKQGMAQSIVPGDYLENWTAGNTNFKGKLRSELKAVVAIAPWGAQPPFNSWDSEGLAGIHIPMLVVAGDQDDVSDYAAGIKPAFEKMTHSDRCLLVYENGRHNVGGNPPPQEVLGDFTTREFFDEPTWRKDRIMAVNEHFITAFLQLYLNGDESRSAYLHVSPEKSNDGTWPLKQDDSVNGKFSDGVNYWKGFQRRWAVGLEMHCAAAAH